VAYESEIRTIKLGIESAKDVLDDLSNERMVDSYYGSRIGNAISNLDAAEVEADYIEDQSLEDDVDLNEVYRQADQIEDYAIEARSVIEKLEELAVDIRNNVRDYA
jgi:hypothetical protein